MASRNTPRSSARNSDSPSQNIRHRKATAHEKISKTELNALVEISAIREEWESSNHRTMDAFVEHFEDRWVETVLKIATETSFDESKSGSYSQLRGPLKSISDAFSDSKSPRSGSSSKNSWQDHSNTSSNNAVNIPKESPKQSTQAAGSKLSVQIDLKSDEDPKTSPPESEKNQSREELYIERKIPSVYNPPAVISRSPTTKMIPRSPISPSPELEPEEPESNGLSLRQFLREEVFSEEEESPEDKKTLKEKIKSNMNKSAKSLKGKDGKYQLKTNLPPDFVPKAILKPWKDTNLYIDPELFESIKSPTMYTFNRADYAEPEYSPTSPTKRVNFKEGHIDIALAMRSRNGGSSGGLVSIFKNLFKKS